MTEIDEKPAQRIERVAASLGLTMTAVFVPWSQSRNKDIKEPSLNWKVTIHKVGCVVLTTDYCAGCGHCPSYNTLKGPKNTVYNDGILRRECETGNRALSVVGSPARSMGQPILPSLPDVLHSLALDADVLNHSTYEDWAGDFGYDKDSRKGEAIYRACLEIALKLRNALGEDGLKQLREACQDY